MTYYAGLIISGNIRRAKFTEKPRIQLWDSDKVQTQPVIDKVRIVLKNFPSASIVPSTLLKLMKINSKIGRIAIGIIASGVAITSLTTPALAYTMRKGGTFSYGFAQSNNRCFILTNDGGNFIIRNTQTKQVMWSTSTSGSKNVLRFEPSGNLVVYVPGPKPKALWQSGTRNQPGARVTLQNDGNFVMYDANNRAIWNSDRFDDSYWSHKC
jgi:hypothetical protein